MPELAIALFLLALGGVVFLEGRLEERRWRKEAEARKQAAE
jgi:hypothetical protein